MCRLQPTPCTAAATLQPCNPIYCLQVTAHEIDQMVQAMDRAGTGKIHYQDYLSMASASVEDQRRHFASDTVT